MKRLCRLFVLVWLAALPAAAQETYVAPPESLVIDGVPQIPMALAETAGRYASFEARAFPTGTQRATKCSFPRDLLRRHNCTSWPCLGASDSKSLFSRTRFRTGGSIR